MLTAHQYYRGVAFGITKENDLQNPLEDSIKQLTNTNSVSWNHTNPTNLVAIKYGINLKYKSKFFFLSCPRRFELLTPRLRIWCSI